MADRTYAMSPPPPGRAASRKTAQSTTPIYLDLTPYVGNFIEVVCVSGSLYYARVPTNATALDIADTTGSAFEPNVPRTLAAEQSDQFEVKKPPKVSDGTSQAVGFLAIRATTGTCHYEVHVR